MTDENQVDQEKKPAAKAKSKAPAKSKAKSQQVATRNDSFPAGIDLKGHEGAGLEGAGREDYAIPFLSIIQKMSPQVDENRPDKLIEGAKVGMFFNTVTSELLSGEKGIHFYPCAYQRRFIHWGPRGSDEGGFKGEFTVEQAEQLIEEKGLINVKGRWVFTNPHTGECDPKKCETLADTRNWFGLLVTDSGVKQVLISMTSTQVKKSKQLVTMLDEVKVNGMTPPIWANRVKLTTVPESNSEGSWHGFRVQLDGFVDSAELFEKGKEFHDLIQSGEAKANYDAAAEAQAAEAEGDSDSM